jgi:hypothetical protein
VPAFSEDEMGGPFGPSEGEALAAGAVEDGIESVEAGMQSLGAERAPEAAPAPEAARSARVFPG